MKELIYFAQNHSINAGLIFHDVSPYLAIITTLLCIVIWQVAKDTNEEARLLREALNEAKACTRIANERLEDNQSKLEDKCAELFAANHINDCLSSENSVLSLKLAEVEKEKEVFRKGFASTEEALGIAMKKLEKYNFPRDSKGHFISKSQPKVAENV